MKKAVITGPTGAIGTAMIKQCISRGISVLAICRKNSKRLSCIPQNPLVTILEWDLEELSGLSKEVLGEEEPFDVFYHLGWNGTFGNARNDMPLQIQNIQSTIEAVKLAKRLGCKVFVGAGSQAEYGRTEGILTPQTGTKPENGYGMAKLCAGMMSRQLCKAEGITHVWVRILSVYGPGDGDATMIMTAIRMLLRGEKPQFTAGEQLWDYLYSEDAARAMLLLGDKGEDGRVYCLGSGQAKPLREYIEMIKEVVNPGGETGIGEVPYSPGQVMHLQADIGELKSDTGFEPQVEFSEGIRRICKEIEMNEGSLK